MVMEANSMRFNQELVTKQEDPAADRGLVQALWFSFRNSGSSWGWRDYCKITSSMHKSPDASSIFDQAIVIVNTESKNYRLDFQDW